MIKAITVLVTVLAFSGCVSVSIGGAKSTRATGVTYREPKAPYSRTTAENVDAIWRNARNGNAISYVSDCGDESDPSLTSIEQGVIAGLAPYVYRSQADTFFEGRAARRIQVMGHVDGVPSLVDLLIFKKNSCIYILTFAGLEKVHDEDGRILDNFISGFHAP